MGAWEGPQDINPRPFILPTGRDAGKMYYPGEALYAVEINGLGVGVDGHGWERLRLLQNLPGGVLGHERGFCQFNRVLPSMGVAATRTIIHSSWTILVNGWVFELREMAACGVN